MPINDPTGPQDAARQPRLRVLQDGKTLAGAISASVTSNNYYRCDTFTLEFAMSANEPGWWDVDPPLVVNIQVSIDDARSWTSLLIGEVDHLTPNVQTGLLIMEGRDLSARLIESKTQEAFFNQTASEVATILAGRHGFKANVAATTTLVGRYYESDHVRGTLDQFSRTTTEWDLLVFLAQREGFDVYMTGTTLNFQPTASESAEPYALVWTPPGPVPRFNAITLRLERSLTIAKDVEVSVRSWSSQQGRGFTKTAKALGGKSANAAGGSGHEKKGSHGGMRAATTQRYVYVIPNLSEAEAQKRANQLAIDITKHERVINCEQAGELVLTPRNMVRLSGTHTSFDQRYHIDSITRTISFDAGFTQSIRCKNSSPRSQVQLG